MRRTASIIIALLAIACGNGEKTPAGQSVYDLSHEPTSVRGWVLDVAGATKGETIEMELGRRTQLFQSTSLWVEGSQYSSGGIAENGAFILLDVPPLKSTIGFSAPGAQTAKVELEGVPGNADVLIPNVILEPNGAKVLDPKAIRVRIPSDVSKPTPTGKNAKVAGYVVPIMNIPLREFTDRRDYPDPGGIRPIAIVK
jgi:hypothetical protein